LSVVQNGNIPQFLDEEMLNNIFQKPGSSLCPAILNIQRGLKETGIYQVRDSFPNIKYFYYDNLEYMLSGLHSILEQCYFYWKPK